MKTQNDEYIVYPNMSDVMGNIFGMSIAGYLALRGFESSIPGKRTPPIFIFLWVLLTLPMTSSYYVLSPGCITAKFLFFVFRKISWLNVNQIFFFREIRTGRKVEKREAILITLRDCVPFYPHIDQPGKFWAKHPLGSILIRMPEGKWDEYVAAFEKYKRDNIKIEFL